MPPDCGQQRAAVQVRLCFLCQPHPDAVTSKQMICRDHPCTSALSATTPQTKCRCEFTVPTMGSQNRQRRQTVVCWEWLVRGRIRCLLQPNRCTSAPTRCCCDSQVPLLEPSRGRRRRCEAGRGCVRLHPEPRAHRRHVVRRHPAQVRDAAERRAARAAVRDRAVDAHVPARRRVLSGERVLRQHRWAERLGRVRLGA